MWLKICQFFRKRMALIQTLHQRHQSRSWLWHMDDRELADIGINRLEAEREGMKRFWE